MLGLHLGEPPLVLLAALGCAGHGHELVVHHARANQEDARLVVVGDAENELLQGDAALGALQGGGDQVAALGNGAGHQFEAVAGARSPVGRFDPDVPAYQRLPALEEGKDSRIARYAIARLAGLPGPAYRSRSGKKKLSCVPWSDTRRPLLAGPVMPRS